MARLLGLVVAIVLVAGCTFSGVDPKLAHCSAAEPACPAGTTCNVTTGLCVGQAGDARVEFARGDGASPDRAAGDGAPRAEQRADQKQIDQKPAPDQLVDQKPSVEQKPLDQALPDAKLADAKLADAKLPDAKLPDAKLTDAKLADKTPKPDVGFCGDNAINQPTEECDGTASFVPKCTDFGYSGGILGCGTNCKFEFNKCTVCGDKIKNGNEQCDTDDLDGKDCKALGRNGGVLQCANDCKFDLSKCCAAPLPPTGLTPDAIVSASAGVDSTTDPLCTPFKTITKALAWAKGTASVVWVAPGVYDAANGESFPLALPEYVTLIGDEATKGAGPSAALATAIDGTGASPSSYLTSLYQAGPGGKGIVKGLLFKSTATSTYGVDNNYLPITVQNNTFSGANGVNLGHGVSGNCNVEVRGNTIKPQNRGVFTQCSTGVTIDANSFSGSDTGIYVTGGGVISNNTFVDNYVPIQVDNNKPLIDKNTFSLSSSTATFASAAIKLWYGSPTVRGCIFKNGPAIQTAGGPSCIPDLGTAGSAGNNDFSALSSVAVSHTVASTIYAIGNIWAAGGVCPHIAILGGGAVVYSSSPPLSCP